MSTDQAAILTAIRGFVVKEFLKGKGSDGLRDDTELVKTGIVDSINVLSLVEFIEDEYDIELEPSDIQRFTSISNIAKGIAAKIDG